jgi:hypothetical protein
MTASFLVGKVAHWLGVRADAACVERVSDPMERER